MIKRIYHLPQDLISQVEESPSGWDWDVLFDNRQEPIVRKGGEPFECRFSEEPCSYDCLIVDPRRSYARLLRGRLACAEEEWIEADLLKHLLLVSGFDLVTGDLAHLAAFHAMFPQSVAHHMAKSYLHVSTYVADTKGVRLVLNNPFFYLSPGASERKLLDVWEWRGRFYSVDVTCEVPSADVVAQEIALLTCTEMESVPSTAVRIQEEIAQLFGALE